MTTDAEDLRRLAALGADALDAAPRYEATIAGLEHTIGDQAAQIAALRRELDQLRPHTLWGANAWRFGTETYAQALARTDKAIGPLAIVRYFANTLTWPTDTGDRPLHISFKWAPKDVIAGKCDVAFRAWCAAAPDRPTWWTYWHEPEDEIAAGQFTAADYRAAWTRLAAIAKASGKDLRATLTLMAWTLNGSTHRDWRNYYAGDDVIDVLAWDAYHKLSGQTDPAKVYAAARQIAVDTGKPWAVAETGVSSVWVTDPAERARLLTALAHDLATVQPRPEFVAYFDTANPSEATGWVWDISRDPQMSAAWKAGRA